VTIEVLEPGALTSVQDAVGRRGWRHLGVPAGGAADAWSARLANRLVGNPDDAALLELTLIGPTLRVLEASTAAFVGALDATVDGMPWPPGSARELRPESIVRVADGPDARAYLAFGGGIFVEPVLGSSSTDLRTGFGGLDGRALRAGDRLQVGPSPSRSLWRWVGAQPTGPIRIVPGPHADRLLPERLTGNPWRLSLQSDRTGARLDGPPLAAAGEEVASFGLPAGAIQVPPDGSPIIALADRPATGGYPVPAVVIGADVGRVARLRPDDELRFASVSLDEARMALRRAEEGLAALEPFDALDDDELRWVGSHE
jgi:5-oxoprolinase (ATP-hydrolysing) subunit C